MGVNARAPWLGLHHQQPVPFRNCKYHPFFCLTLSFCRAGVLPSDHEDAAKGSEEAADGEVPGRGRSGLWRSGEVRSWGGPTCCCTGLRAPGTGGFQRRLSWGSQDPLLGPQCSWDGGCVTATRTHVSFALNLLLGKTDFSFSAPLPTPTSSGSSKPETRGTCF